MSNHKTLALSLMALLFAGAFAFGHYGVIPADLEPVEAAEAKPLGGSLPRAVHVSLFGSLPKSEPAPPDTVMRNDEVPEIVLESDAAFAVTNKGEVLFEQNADAFLPIASVTKVLTALTALEYLSLDDDIVVSPAAVRTDGNFIDLRVGDRLSLHDALLAMLLPSSNDAAVAIAEATGNVGEFVARMNEKAEELGAGEVEFYNPHGLAPPGNFATARGVATMMHEALKNPDLARILRQPEAWVTSREGNEYYLLHRGNGLTRYPNMLGAKTGFTDESRGTLVFAYRPDTHSDRVVVTVILGSDERATDTEALATWVKGAYAFPPAQAVALTQ